MGLGHIANQIKSDNITTVTEATFGHLAPMKNFTYRGEIKIAVGHYDVLNPTIIDIELKGLEDSPWLFQSIKELLWDIGSNVLKGGFAYVIKITFRNYRFWTKIKQIEI